MAFDATVASQEWEQQTLNASHNLAHVDVTRPFTSVAEDIEPGTLLKESGGDYEPWIQGTDPAGDIAAVYAGPNDLDTGSRESGLVRIFGPINHEALVAWTSGDGSTTADPSAGAITELQDQKIFPM